MAQRKATAIKVRVHKQIKAALVALAEKRFTTESELARQAVVEYLAKHGALPGLSLSSVPEVSGEELARMATEERARELARQEQRPASSSPAPASAPKPSKVQRRKRERSSHR